MATYAIGDLQGCWLSLQALLDRVGYDPAEDRLWLVGDLVNRGPGSLEVLRFVRDLGERATVVLGNHDLHLLARAAGCRKPGKRDTLDRVLAAPDRDDLLDWLRAQPFVHREDGFLLVHAGLLPQWTGQDAERISSEASSFLQSEGVAAIREHSRDPRASSWDEGLRDGLRAAAAINAFTALRCCTAGGEMDLEHAGAPEDSREGRLAWHAVPGRRSSDETVVCGHWAAQGLVIQEELICLDSGCVWGGELTAVRLEDRQVFSVPAAEKG
jgi:bis(5'-nucleosyl)-tetraphosphatase (symmetrical)